MLVRDGPIGVAPAIAAAVFVVNGVGVLKPSAAHAMTVAHQMIVVNVSPHREGAMVVGMIVVASTTITIVIDVQAEGEATGTE